MVGFIVLISSLCKKDWFIRRGIHESNIDSNKVQEYIKDGQEHPAIEFYYCFSCREPDAAITYEWSLTFEEILSFLNPRQLIWCSMKYKKMIPFHLDRLYIWIEPALRPEFLFETSKWALLRGDAGEIRG